MSNELTTDNSDTFVHDFRSQQPLGKGTQIRFTCPTDPGHFPRYIDVMTTSAGELRIMASDGISVEPIAGNALTVRVRS